MRVNKVQVAAGVLRARGIGRLLRRAPAWSGLLVLNYHRIGDPTATSGDPDLYSATAEAFDAQAGFLARNADVVLPGDLPALVRRGRGRYVLLTFDDGYRDNFEVALPILRAHGLRATFFLCTGFLDDSRPAWWDEIAWMVRRAKPPRLALPDWLPNPLPLDEPGRAVARRAVTQRFKELPGDRTAPFLDALAEATGAGRMPPTEAIGLWMTWEMARALRDAGMAIGAHTVSHPILSRLSPERQAAEIAGSRDRIAAELGTVPRWFAYPVGYQDSFDVQTRAALRAHDFDLGFSFYGGHQPFAPFDPYDVRRAHVGHDTTRAVFEGMVMLPGLFARWGRPNGASRVRGGVGIPPAPPRLRGSIDRVDGFPTSD